MKKTSLKKTNVAKLLLILLTLCAALTEEAQAQITQQAANERVAALASLIAAAPTDDKLYAERANLYFVVGKLDDALADASKAVAINPKSNVALIIRGNIKVKKKDYDGAIADYSEAIKIFPTRAFRAYFFRGEVYEFKGDFDQALADYNKAAEIDKSIDEAATRARLRVYDKQARIGKSGGVISANESKIPAVWSDGDFAVPDSEYIVGKIVSHDGKSYSGIVILGKLLDESTTAIYVSTMKTSLKNNYRLGFQNKIIVKESRGFKVYEAFVVDASETNLEKAKVSNNFKNDLTQLMSFKYLKLAFDRSLVLVKKDAAHPSLKVEIVDILDSSNLSVLRRQPFPFTNEKKAYADLLDGEIKADNLDEAKAVYQQIESLAAKSVETDETKATRKTNLTKLYRRYDLKPFVEQEMTKYNYTEAEKQAVRGETIPK